MPVMTRMHVDSSNPYRPEDGADPRQRRQAFIRAWRINQARCYAYLRWRLRAASV